MKKFNSYLFSLIIILGISVNSFGNHINNDSSNDFMSGIKNDDKTSIEISRGIWGSFSKNSAGLLEGNINITNNSSKTIKYLTLEILAINAVGDVMRPDVGSNRCRITGPIYPKDTDNISLDCGTYYRGGIDRLDIRVISVVYMDGTSKENPSEVYQLNTNFYTIVIISTTISVVLGFLLAL